MQLYARRKTDAEHVETIRRMIARSRWLALFYGSMGCLYLIIAILWHGMIFKTDEVFPELAASMDSGVRLGITLGVMQGVIFVFAAGSIGWAVYVLRGLRTERLLLKYHDELRKVRDHSQMS